MVPSFKKRYQIKSQIIINRNKSNLPIKTTTMGSNGERSKKVEMAEHYNNSSMISEGAIDYRREFGYQEPLVRNYEMQSKSMQQTLPHYDRKDKAKVA
jgi:hypothetical protein